MRTGLSILLSLGLCDIAHARDAGDALSVLLGTSTAFDGNPATIRLSVRGEYGFAEGDWLGGSFLLPLTWSTEGEDRFGVSPRQSLFELPLSVRGRLFPDSGLRFYGDAGLGLAVGTSRFDDWVFEDGRSPVAIMTRTALGVELGNPDSWGIAIEPVSWTNYFTARHLQATYGLMLGLIVSL